MKTMKKLTILLLSLILTTLSFAQEKNVSATVLKVRGKVEAKLPSGKVIKVKKGDKLPSLTTLTSSAKSFAVVQMVDKTKLTLGPKSEIQLKVLSQKNKPGLINLLKGQLRSNVKPDKVKKNKLFIKANMAAIGVRGTETVMVYNDKSDKFTMGGLTGEVIAVALKKGQDLKVDTLNKIIQPGNPVAYQIPPKNFSSISVKDGKTKITKPQVMNTTQFHALRRNEVPKFETQNKKESQKGRSLRLPGVSLEQKDPMAEAISVSLSEPEFGDQQNEPEAAPAGAKQDPPPAPAFKMDPDAAQYLATDVEKVDVAVAGAALDLNTGTIIMPSPTDAYDPNTGTVIPSQAFGSIAPDGSFLPPQGFEFSDDGQLVQEQTDTPSDKDRSVASNEPNMPPAVIELPKIEEYDMKDFEVVDDQILVDDSADFNDEAKQDLAKDENNSLMPPPGDGKVADSGTFAPPDQFMDFDDSIVVDGDCPTREICDNFNSASPTTQDIITRSAVRFKIIIDR